MQKCSASVMCDERPDGISTYCNRALCMGAALSCEACQSTDMNGISHCQWAGFEYKYQHMYTARISACVRLAAGLKDASIADKALL